MEWSRRILARLAPIPAMLSRIADEISRRLGRVTGFRGL